MVGTGLGTFSFAFQKDQPLIAYRFNRLHNDYLECLIENGILPFILILILIAMYYKKLFNNWHALNSQTQRILILSVASSITIILMLSLIDFPLQLGAIAVLFTIIAALGLALGNNYEHTRSLSKYNFGSVAISLIICFILLIFSAKMLVFDLKRLSFSNLKDLSIAELNEQKTDFTKYSIDNAEGHYILGSKRLNACVKEVDFAIESLKKGNYVADTQWRLMMKENLKIVVQELLEGAILEPNNSKYWVRLGQTLELIEWVSDLSNPISVEMIESELKEPVRMGELSQAAEILYLRAIDIDPINIESYTALAKIYYKHGKLAEAIKMYQNSLYIGGQDYLLLHSFEDIYKQERQSKE
jgi:tetratricopeptide (TPR) repeat protein